MCGGAMRRIGRYRYRYRWLDTDRKIYTYIYIYMCLSIYLYIHIAPHQQQESKTHTRTSIYLLSIYLSSHRRCPRVRRSCRPPSPHSRARAPTSARSCSMHTRTHILSIYLSNHRCPRVRRSCRPPSRRSRALERLIPISISTFVDLSTYIYI